jgi:hypothetical protein
VLAEVLCGFSGIAFKANICHNGTLIAREKGDVHNIPSRLLRKPVSWSVSVDEDPISQGQMWGHLVMR